MRCFNCGGYGHRSAACASAKMQLCLKCGKPGHMAAECRGGAPPPPADGGAVPWQARPDKGKGKGKEKGKDKNDSLMTDSKAKETDKSDKGKGKSKSDKDKKEQAADWMTARLSFVGDVAADKECIYWKA